MNALQQRLSERFRHRYRNVQDVRGEFFVMAYPALTGFTVNGPGTMSGEVLSRIDDGITTHLVARYEVADPRGSNAFKAVIQGEANDKTGKYELNGIVTWGWMLGAHVRVMFDRMSPCEFGKLNVCFQGTIEIQGR